MNKAKALPDAKNMTITSIMCDDTYPNWLVGYQYELLQVDSDGMM